MQREHYIQHTLPLCKYKHYICNCLISNKENHTQVTN